MIDVASIYAYPPQSTPLGELVRERANVRREPDGADVSQGKLFGWAARKLGIQKWGQILIIGLFAASLVFWRKLDALEGELHVFMTQQAAFQQQLIQRLLDRALAQGLAGNSEEAIRTVQIASVVVATAKQAKTAAEAGVFSEALERINKVSEVVQRNPDAEDAVSAFRLALVEYRSALEQVPALGAKESVDKPVLGAKKESVDKPVGGPFKVLFASMVLRPPVIDCSGIRFELDCIRPTTTRRLADDRWLKNLVIADARQTLDGFHWKNVTFLNSRVKYAGGEVDLQNVRFVNCTFEFAPVQHAEELANVLALGQKYFFVGAKPLASRPLSFISPS
jgi:hypothetical protein